MEAQDTNMDNSSTLYSVLDSAGLYLYPARSLLQLHITI